MVVLPISGYYATKLAAEELFSIADPTSAVCGAVSAIAIVHVIIGLYVYRAWLEDTAEEPEVSAKDK
eukprot:m.285309 g.285309  ORF g.285309 m.285309 type:complete len:67 (-) comp11354_c0_seq1:99-299(-)